MRRLLNSSILGMPSRRHVLRAGALMGAALAMPAIGSRSAFGADAKKLNFISEESSPKAQAVYNKINADFTKETGIAVTVEYPGFEGITQRVATLIAAGTPADLVWYGVGSALEVALAGQFAPVDDIVAEQKLGNDLRLVHDGHDRAVATSQQFVYGWYRSDLMEKGGQQPFTDWNSYLNVIKGLNAPPVYGAVIPSAQNGASHLLALTMMMKNDVHLFKMSGAGEYEVALDEGDNLKGAIETLDFLNEAHQYSPEASNCDWAELMSLYFSGRAATSYYAGARMLEQTMSNAPDLADFTKPISLPAKKTDNYYVSVQAFHVASGGNVDGAKQYIRFFLNHPEYISWLHAVPLHTIPASREILRSAAFQNNEVIQKRMDVLEYIDSIWGKGRAPYYWDGEKLNPYAGIYENDNTAGWMVAQRNIAGRDAESVVKEAAEMLRTKQADIKSKG